MEIPDDNSSRLRLPPKTVERLSKYRRMLIKYMQPDQVHIFSHKLAGLLNLTPEQVRRDMMLIGLNGNHRRGYHIQALIERIGETIDREDGYNIALVGIGNLGRALLGFIRKSATNMHILAAFDLDKNKVNTSIAGVPCYHIQELGDVIKQKNIRIAILTVPPEAAPETGMMLINNGIKGILNFTSVHLDVPPDIYLKDYDIITSLEEIGFFIKE
jgi:redox-sensing transcriptional repressor